MALDYKIKSFLTVAVILVIMVGLGFLVNYFQEGITGGAIVSGIACDSNEECNDGIACTIDSCKYPGTEQSFCVNSPVDYCKDGDGCCPPGCKGNDNDC